MQEHIFFYYVHCCSTNIQKIQTTYVRKQVKRESYEVKFECLWENSKKIRFSLFQNWKLVLECFFIVLLNIAVKSSDLDYNWLLLFAYLQLL